MKTKKLNLRKWISLLFGILLITLSSCSKDEIEPSNKATLNPIDTTPELQEDYERYYN